jgi:transcriptional regulator
MYTPPANVVAANTEIRDLVTAVGSAQLITCDAAGYPQATLLPIMWHGDVVIAHMARANPHWRLIGDDSPTLLVCTGAQAYVSPSWYAAKAEHGKVVPTWNYSAVHLTGTARIHEDTEWLRDAVTTLTDVHETARSPRWQVTDAPSAYIDGQLRGIVGIEVRIARVEGKAKLSQNRSDADRRGVIAGLQNGGSHRDVEVAADMSAALPN